MNKKIEFKHISIHEGPEKSPGFLLWHISTSWRSSIEAVLKPLHLTHPQFVVLATLGWLTKDGEFVTQATLGKMAGLDPNTTSQILRGLEEKQLIKRVISSDPRAKNPIVTTQGSLLLTEALPTVEKADTTFFKNLASEESSSLIQIFQKLMTKQ